MNVSLNKTDNVNGTITIEMERADVQENVDKSLTKLRRQASIPGFRPGKVPMSVVRKLYGESVLMEELNNLINSSLSDYIRESKLPLLGEPIPVENREKAPNLLKDEKLTFDFEVGFAPEVDFVFDENDSLPYYKVKLEEHLLDEQIEGYKQLYGAHEKVDEAALETDLLRGTVTELENGEPKEDGLVVEDAILMPSHIKNDEETKARFVGANVGDEVVINPKKAYDNDAEVASFLRIPKDDAVNVDSDFTFKITEITRFKEAEVNQEMFDNVLGKDVASNEADFRTKVQESLNSKFVPDADYFFMKEARKLMLQKMEDLEFPEEFLKKWLKITNEKATDELIEKDFPNILNDIKYQLAKDKIRRENQLEVTENDVHDLAMEVTQMQFAQYGMAHMPAEMLEDYVKRMLEKEETVEGLVAKVVENKIAAWLKENVTIEEKEITSEEFAKITDEEFNAMEESEEEEEAVLQETSADEDEAVAEIHENKENNAEEEPKSEE